MQLGEVDYAIIGVAARRQPAVEQDLPRGDVARGVEEMAAPRSLLSRAIRPLMRG
jgi:hypothetical protein